MLTAKKKITQREAVRVSRATTIWYDAQEWFRVNARMVGGIAIGVVAVAAALYFYTSAKASDDIEANRKLRPVMEMLQQQQYPLAISGDPARGITGLKDIAAQYDNTPTGQQAMLYLGQAYLALGEYDKALAALEDASPEGDLPVSSVTAAKGAVFEARKKYAEAGDLYRKAAEQFENEYITTERYFLAGRAYAMAGDKEQAKEMLEKVRESKSQRHQPEAERLMTQYGLD